MLRIDIDIYLLNQQSWFTVKERRGRFPIHEQLTFQLTYPGNAGLLTASKQ